jgi:integrase
MPRKMLPNVERNLVRGKNYYSFRIGKGPRIRLPDDPSSEEFRAAYLVAMEGEQPRSIKRDAPGTLGALIASYLRNAGYVQLRDTSKLGYMSRLNRIRTDHGHRTVSGLTRERIISKVLAPYADRPAAALDTLKKLRILIRHAIDLGWLTQDPSQGIKRSRTKEIRAWTDAELAAFEKRWPLGTKQRTAYALMLHVGAARVDVHGITWAQFDGERIEYTRSKTGVAVYGLMQPGLRAALDATTKSHVTILNTEFGKPFTVAGFSGFMRDAIKAAGLPLDCRPHGLRKTMGRQLADANASAHDIMAALGHTTLAQAENYTREADRKRGGRRAVERLNDHKANKSPQNALENLGKIATTERKTK